MFLPKLISLLLSSLFIFQASLLMRLPQESLTCLSPAIQVRCPASHVFLKYSLHLVKIVVARFLVELSASVCAWSLSFEPNTVLNKPHDQAECPFPGESKMTVLRTNQNPKVSELSEIMGNFFLWARTILHSFNINRVGEVAGEQKTKKVAVTSQKCFLLPLFFPLLHRLLHSVQVFPQEIQLSICETYFVSNVQTGQEHTAFFFFFSF